MQSQRAGEIDSTFAIVGGVYRELCRLPLNDETWGSGGRAAAIIAGLDIQATLFTAVDANTSGLLASLAHIFKFDVRLVPIETTLRFQYDHALSRPLIWPPLKRGDQAGFSVEAEEALVFGMLEATPTVTATRLVYDPQNPANPVPFDYAPKSSSSIAYVLNSVEAKKLAGADDLTEAAQRISNQHRVETVVIKCGPWGAIVYEDGRAERTPAYETKSVWPIGSGDVFAAVFAARWARQQIPAIEAAQQASRAAAVYVNSHVLPVLSDQFSSPQDFKFPPLTLNRSPLGAAEYHVYLAGPFFNIGQSWLVEESRLALQGWDSKSSHPVMMSGSGLLTKSLQKILKRYVKAELFSPWWTGSMQERSLRLVTREHAIYQSLHWRNQLRKNR
jgi:pfkB family carbohydrate kinase